MDLEALLSRCGPPDAVSAGEATAVIASVREDPAAAGVLPWRPFSDCRVALVATHPSGAPQSSADTGAAGCAATGGSRGGAAIGGSSVGGGTPGSAAASTPRPELCALATAAAAASGRRRLTDLQLRRLALQVGSDRSVQTHYMLKGSK